VGPQCRFGSNASVSRCPPYVRFTPTSRNFPDPVGLRTWANSEHSSSTDRRRTIVKGDSMGVREIKALHQAFAKAAVAGTLSAQATAILGS
jgi:hypothetical protein